MTDPLFSLNGRTILLTGAGGAIGSVVATALAERGARLALQDISADKLGPVRQAVEAAGGTAITLPAD
ncbi:MAG: SDR family NAD(P)-dependent oxidoreductase, partial [Candidatus Nanopelagicales bacterium]|nr:SDR family NAD(P)-dependent oxidoreductase [Candidatus Nanopelagicales bacterium]